LGVSNSSNPASNQTNTYLCGSIIWDSSWAK
jgi:hypothetical protein